MRPIGGGLMLCLWLLALLSCQVPVVVWCLVLMSQQGKGGWEGGVGQVTHRLRLASHCWSRFVLPVKQQRPRGECVVMHVELPCSANGAGCGLVLLGRICVGCHKVGNGSNCMCVCGVVW